MAFISQILLVPTLGHETGSTDRTDGLNAYPGSVETTSYVAVGPAVNL